MFFHHHHHRGDPRRPYRDGGQGSGSEIGRGGWHGQRGGFDSAWSFAGMPGRGGGGRRGRMFDGGELRLVLLRLIGDEPRHGYDLIREIEAITGGAYAPSPGVVYPTLTLLDEMGLIGEQRSEGAKKRFAVTEAGTRHLVEQAEQVDALMARLRALGEQRDRGDRAALRRAVGNLKVALAGRFGGGDASDDTVHAAVALIDEVAQKIERLK